MITIDDIKKRGHLVTLLCGSTGEAWRFFDWLDRERRKRGRSNTEVWHHLGTRYVKTAYWVDSPRRAASLALAAVARFEKHRNRATRAIEGGEG